MGHTVVCYEDASAFDFDISVVNPNSVDYTLTINGTTALGTFDVVDNNTVTFTPALNQNGYTTIQYTVEEVGGGETGYRHDLAACLSGQRPAGH